jgi:hypothetical protein
MIEKYVDKLIKNLPKESKVSQKLDIVFDGGAFNGSYLVGAAYFLKSMESKSYIEIDRMSACSIGSFVSLLYVADCLEIFTDLYQMLMNHFKTNHQLNNFDAICKKIEPRLPKNICHLMTNKVYISFYDLKKNKKIVKHKYKSLQDIFDTIYKSSFVPFLMDGNILHKGRYFDGVSPFIFKKEPDKKILFLDLFGYDKIGNLLNIKNEKTNYHRILSGLLDIHDFYIKQSNTHMCSYVNEWGFLNQTHFIIKKLVEYFVFYFIRVYIYIKNNIPDVFHENIISKIVAKIMKDIYIILIENYCF